MDAFDFEHEIDSETRTKFIQYVKFPPSIQKDENLSPSIQKVVNDLNKILRTLRIFNEDNSITIFILLGRKNLMAEVG